jgi:hypothetical protein
VADKVTKVVVKAVPAKNSGKFVWGQLRELSDFYEHRVSLRRQKAAADRARAEVETSTSGATLHEGES